MSSDVTLDVADATLDAAVGTIVHDLRAPVASIVAAARLLARPEIEADATARLLQIVDRSEAMVATIIDDLTARARPGLAGTRARRTLLLVDGVLEGVAEVVGSAREVTVEVDGASGVTIWSHERTLTRLLLNLVDNAARHSGRQTVTVSVVADGDRLDLIVTDGGPGLPDPIARWLLHRDPVDRSTIEADIGHGLTTAIRLARELDGSLGLDPTWAGTRISVSLPRRGDDVAPEPTT